jgi:type II secretion system protein H
VTRALRRPTFARRAGFTLIELLAVMLIFALLAGIALPNFGVRASRALDDESKRLASELEFARQRAVMTGVPHRLLFDLDEDVYWIEWLVSDARALDVDAADVAPAATQGGPLQLVAPRGEEPRYRPLAGSLGGVTELDELVALQGIETPQGYFEQGRVQIEFAGDGTSDPASVVLADPDGRTVDLVVEPLADSVWFRRE